MRPLLGSILYLLRDPCGVSTMTSTSMSGSFGGGPASGSSHAYPATSRSHKRHLALKNLFSSRELNHGTPVAGGASEPGRATPTALAWPPRVRIRHTVPIRRINVVFRSAGDPGRS